VAKRNVWAPPQQNPAGGGEPGHVLCDGRQVGGDHVWIELSRRRAAAVRDVLVAEFGIDASRMDPDGRGEAEPAAPNDTPAASWLLLLSVRR
jgi:NADPH-dependent ferric siderophore reductase